MQTRIPVTINPTDLSEDQAILLRDFLRKDENKEQKVKEFEPNIGYKITLNNIDYRFTFTHRITRNTRTTKKIIDGKVSHTTKLNKDGNKQYVYRVFEKKDQTDIESPDKIKGKGAFGATYFVKGKLKYHNDRIVYEKCKPHKPKLIKEQFVEPHSTVENHEKEAELLSLIPRNKTKKINFIKNKGNIIKSQITFAEHPGLSLKEVIANIKNYSIKKRLQLTQLLLERLKELHDAGIMHLDIKPENIIVDMDSDPIQVNIIDLGLAEKIGTKLKDGCGTILYSAPELMYNNTGDQRSDIFSLGFILRELWRDKIFLKVSRGADLEITKNKIAWYKTNLEKGDYDLDVKLKPKFKYLLGQDNTSIIETLLMKTTTIHPDKRLPLAAAIVGIKTIKYEEVKEVDDRPFLERHPRIKKAYEYGGKGLIIGAAIAFGLLTIALTALAVVSGLGGLAVLGISAFALYKIGAIGMAAAFCLPVVGAVVGASVASREEDDIPIKPLNNDEKNSPPKRKLPMSSTANISGGLNNHVTPAKGKSHNPIETRTSGYLGDDERKQNIAPVVAATYHTIPPDTASKLSALQEAKLNFSFVKNQTNHVNQTLKDQVNPQQQDNKTLSQ